MWSGCVLPFWTYLPTTKTLIQHPSLKTFQHSHPKYFLLQTKQRRRPSWLRLVLSVTSARPTLWAAQLPSWTKPTSSLQVKSACFACPPLFRENPWNLSLALFIPNFRYSGIYSKPPIWISTFFLLPLFITNSSAHLFCACAMCVYPLRISKKLLAFFKFKN